MLLWMALACHDYDFQEVEEIVVEGEDTAVVDEPPPEDTGEVVASAPLYGNTSTTLYQIDPQKGGMSEIGDFHDANGPIDQFIDIAIDLDGYMVGGTFDALYRVDPSTAFVTHICDTEVEMTALTFASSGELITGGDAEIRWMDIDTCASSLLVSSSTYATSGDLVGLPDGYLYWTVEGSDGDELVVVNPETGAQMWNGRIGVSALFGLGYHNDKLYGFSAEGDIVEITPSNAQISDTISSGVAWWGAATNPVVWGK